MTPHERYFEYNGQRISYREGEVLLAYALGWKIADTANALCVSKKTIERHRENIRLRFGLQEYHDLRCFSTKLQPELEKWVNLPIKMGKDTH